MTTAKLTLVIEDERVPFGRRSKHIVKLGALAAEALTKPAAIADLARQVNSLAEGAWDSTEIVFADDGGVFVLTRNGPGWMYLIQRPGMRTPSACLMNGSRADVRRAMMAHLEQYNAPGPAVAME